MKSLKNKVVVLTGAGGGLGTELAMQMALEGADLILVDKKMEYLELLKQHVLASAPGPAHGKILGMIECDLASQDGALRVFQMSMELSKDIDIVINNAGISCYGYFTDLEERQWEELLRINLISPMKLSSYFVKLMTPNHRGHIVNISSVLGFIGVRKFVPYCTSKFALSGFSEALADEIKKHRIKITTVYPYFINTKMLEVESGDGKRKVVKENLMSDPALIAKLIVKGIKKEKSAIYPGVRAKMSHFIKSHAAWLIKWLR